jgi:hypothetical protein
MLVTVTKDENIYTMGYDPCHYEELVKWYANEQAEGRIDSYLIHI